MPRCEFAADIYFVAASSIRVLRGALEERVLPTLRSNGGSAVLTFARYGRNAHNLEGVETVRACATSQRGNVGNSKCERRAGRVDSVSGC